MEKILKLLIVDDEPTAIFPLKDAILNAFGNVEIIVANSKQEAQDIILKNNDFALMIIDVQIPEKPGIRSLSNDLGLRLIEEVRNDNKTIPIIAYTSFSKDTIIRRIYNARASYIFKFTSSPESVLKEIAKLL